jgi:hypothetical protein
MVGVTEAGSSSVGRGERGQTVLGEEGKCGLGLARPRKLSSGLKRGVLISGLARPPVALGVEVGVAWKGKLNSGRTIDGGALRLKRATGWTSSGERAGAASMTIWGAR